MSALHRACLAAALAGALAASETLPGVPTADQIHKDLCSGDQAATRRALGMIYLLPPAQLDVLERHAKDDGTPGIVYEPLETARLIAGHPATIKTFAERLVRQTGGVAPGFFDRFRPAELAPLADAVAKLLAREPDPSRLLPGEWLQLAARSGDVALLKAAGGVVLKGGPSGGFPAAAFLAANADRLAAGSVEDRERLLRAVRPGFATAPSRDVLALLAAREPRLREAAFAALRDSTAPEALAAAQKLVHDADAEIARLAADVVLTFRPTPVDALKALALDAKADAGARANAWRMLANRDDAPVDAARTVLERDQEPAPVRLACVDLLVARHQGAYLLTRLARLPADVQGEALRALVASGDDVTAPLTRFLDEADPATSESVLVALAQSRTPSAQLAVIERIKDHRPAMRRAAAEAIGIGTGLRGPQVLDQPAAPAPAPAQPRRRAGAAAPAPAPAPAGDAPTAKQKREADRAARAQRQRAAATADHAYAVWRAWWDRGRAPLDAEREAVHAQTKLVLDADRDDPRGRTAAKPVAVAAAAAEPPVWSLARWADDRAVGGRALRRLGAHPDAAATAALSALLDDPGCAARHREVCEALARRPRDAATLANLAERLDDDDALVVLVAWRDGEHLEAILDAAFARGSAFERIRGDLVAWNPPALAKSVRRYALAKPDDAEVSPQARRIALALLIESATDADIRGLAELARRPEGGEAVAALAQMAAGGSPAAQQALAATLAPKHPAVANALEAVIQSAPRANRDPAAPAAVVVAPETVLAAVRALTREPALAARAWTALIAWSDVGSVDGIRAFAAANPKAAPNLVAALDGRDADALPIAEALLAAPVAVDEARRVVAWMARAGVDAKRVKQLQDGLERQKHEALDDTLGAPAGGVTIALEPIDEAWKPDGEVKIVVVVKNVGRKPVTALNFFALNLIGDPTGPLMLTTGVLELAGLPISGPNKNLVTLAPGKSVRTTLTTKLGHGYAASFAAMRYRVEAAWSAIGDDIRDQTKFTSRSAWVPCSLAPELWLAIDKRPTK